MVDATQVEKDLYEEKMKEQNSKMESLESELQKYKEKEQQELEQKEKERQEELQNKIKTLEEENQNIKQSFEEKLEQISQRATTANSGDDSESLTYEDYKKLDPKEREKYDSAALKESLKGRGVFE